MKLKLLTSQLENEDLSHYYLKEQSECTDDDPNFTKYFEKIKLLQDSFESRFRDFPKEEDCVSAFINQFLLSEQEIMKMPSVTYKCYLLT